jgi:hypothetical protein
VVKRKIAYISFPNGIFSNLLPLYRQHFIKIIEALPCDTKILNCYDNYDTAQWRMLIESNSLREVEEGKIIPLLEIDMRIDFKGHFIIEKICYLDNGEIIYNKK